MVRNIGPLLEKPRGGGSGRRLKQWDFGHRLRVTDFFLPSPSPSCLPWCSLSKLLSLLPLDRCPLLFLRSAVGVYCCRRLPPLTHHHRVAVLSLLESPSSMATVPLTAFNPMSPTVAVTRPRRYYPPSSSLPAVIDAAHPSSSLTPVIAIAIVTRSRHHHPLLLSVSSIVTHSYRHPLLLPSISALTCLRYLLSTNFHSAGGLSTTVRKLLPRHGQADKVQSA